MILINASFDRECVRNGMALAMVMAMAMTMAMTTAIVTGLSSPRPRRSRGRGRGVMRTSQYRASSSQYQPVPRYAYEGHQGVRAQRFLNSIQFKQNLASRRSCTNRSIQYDATSDPRRIIIEYSPFCFHSASVSTALADRIIIEYSPFYSINGCRSRVR